MALPHIGSEPIGRLAVVRKVKESPGRGKPLQAIGGCILYGHVRGPAAVSTGPLRQRSQFL